MHIFNFSPLIPIKSDLTIYISGPCNGLKHGADQIRRPAKWDDLFTYVLLQYSLFLKSFTPTLSFLVILFLKVILFDHIQTKIILFNLLLKYHAQT